VSKVTQFPGSGNSAPPVDQSPPASEMQQRPDLQPTITKLCNAMGAVSVMEAAHSNDVPIGEPDFKRACRAVYETLDDVLTALNNLDDELAKAG